MEANYNKFCESKNCPEYIEWSFNDGFGCNCISCKLVGQSYDITEYPDDCLFKEKIEKITLIRKKTENND